MKHGFVLMDETPGAAGGAPGAASPPAWYAGFADEGLRSWVAAKGLPSAEDAVRSYQNAEKFIGAPADELVRVPKNATTADEMAVFDRLGRPKEPTGYEIEVPPEYGDSSFAEWAKGAFHKVGLTGRQGKEITQAWNAYVQEQTAARAAGYAQTVAAEELALKNEWGAGFEAKMATAKRAAQQFGFDGAAIDALEQSMGYGGVMKFMAALGSKIGEEHQFVTGKTAGFGDMLTPADAQAQIAAKRMDSGFVKRYMEGDGTARAEMDRLHRLAYPDG